MDFTGKNHIEYLKYWMLLPEHQILSKFLDYSSDAIEFGEGHYKSVFIPGTRKDRVLLVAHVDTVWKDSLRIKIVESNGLLFSGNQSFYTTDDGCRWVKGTGIGADDRAGIAAIWALKDLGHSILLTGAEELGCIGAAFIMADAESADLIQDHQFAVELDRRGIRDLVFYNVGTSIFRKYCEQKTGYITEHGSFSDIAILCEKICGVNISIGYKNEHMPTEILNIRWWNNTVDIVRNWLSKKNLPKFELGI